MTSPIGRFRWNATSPPRVRVVAAMLALAGVTTLAWASSQFAMGTTITGYGTYATGAYITFAPAQPGLEGCTYAAGNQLWIDMTTPDGKTLYATFLAAMLAGKAVGFGVSGCINTSPVVYRVDVGL
jgi:hypothetical protein